MHTPLKTPEVGNLDGKDQFAQCNRITGAERAFGFLWQAVEIA